MNRLLLILFLLSSLPARAEWVFDGASPVPSVAYADDAGTAGTVRSIAGHPVSALANDAGFLTSSDLELASVAYAQNADSAATATFALSAGTVDSLSGRNISELSNDAEYLTLASAKYNGLVDLEDVAHQGYLSSETDPWAQSQGFMTWGQASDSFLEPGDLLNYDLVWDNELSGASVSHASTAGEAQNASTADYATSAGTVSSIAGLSISSLNNDAGFITSESDPWASAQGFATEGWVQSQQYLYSYELQSSLNSLGYFTQADFESSSGDMMINTHGYVKQAWTEQYVQDSIANAGHLTSIDGLNVSTLLNDAGYLTNTWSYQTLRLQAAGNTMAAGTSIFFPTYIDRLPPGNTAVIDVLQYMWTATNAVFGANAPTGIVLSVADTWLSTGVGTTPAGNVMLSNAFLGAISIYRHYGAIPTNGIPLFSITNTAANPSPHMPALILANNSGYTLTNVGAVVKIRYRGN